MGPQCWKQRELLIEEHSKSRCREGLALEEDLAARSVMIAYDCEVLLDDILENTLGMYKYNTII